MKTSVYTLPNLDTLDAILGDGEPSFIYLRAQRGASKVVDHL